LDCACDVFDRHVRVYPLLVEQIDMVGVQALEGLLGNRADAFGPAVAAVRDVAVLESELCGDHDLIAHRRQRLAHHLLVSLAVGLGGVEEGHAELNACPDQLHRLIDVRGRSVPESQPHAAKAEC
jgi:hypothetical protein